MIYYELPGKWAQTMERSMRKHFRTPKTSKDNKKYDYVKTNDNPVYHYDGRVGCR